MNEIALGELSDVVVMAEGLKLPEGPVAMADGSVIVVELRGGRLSRVLPDGEVVAVADLGGAPNGAARGPDGAIYVCNNGGSGQARTRGSIQRVDVDTGESVELYIECDGVGLGRPNDLVFDREGGLWFTDYELRNVYYAAADGGQISRVWTGLTTPNGVGLSPDEQTLYVTQTAARQVLRRRIGSPGVLVPQVGHDARAYVTHGSTDPDSLLVSLGGTQELDSLAIDSDGAICAGVLVDSGVLVVAADGSSLGKYTLPEHLADPLLTNICFGGPDMQTAYLTASGTGRLLSCRWPRPGLRLNFQE